MIRQPSINFILQRALRRIGAFAVSSSGARANEMEEARYWLDMHMAHLAARKRTWWLVQETQTFPLVAGQREYVLEEVLSPEAGVDGIQTVIALYVDQAATGAVVQQVNLLRRQEFEEAVGDAVNASGPPSAAHIDRAQRPTLRFLEAPDDAVPYVARIVYQTYSPDLVAGRDNRRLERFRTTWDLYLVTALASLIANGPVRKLPKDEVDDLKREAAVLLHDLESYDDHEQENTPVRVLFHDGI
jgi:hypothetical protein